VEILQFLADVRLHKTVVLASPVLRRMLSKMLLECESVSHEEDVIEHIRLVAGLLSRMSVPRYDKKQETVDQWIQKFIPKYVQNAEPGAPGQVSNRQRCETIKNVLTASQQLNDVAAELEVSVTCGMLAGMMNATWMMEAKMHVTQLADIYPDEAAEALPYVMHFSEY
jgi:hypothetical protein